MAIINNLKYVNEVPNVRTLVEADYCYNKNYFQIRTYKTGDVKMEFGAKQNIQIDKQMAKKLIHILNEFINC